MADGRVVYGARCSWWDTIDRTATTPSGLPCCPHCGGVLLEAPSLSDWWASVDAHEELDHPGYRTFIEWARGRCFPTIGVAQLEHDKHRRQTHG